MLRNLTTAVLRKGTGQGVSSGRPTPGPVLWAGWLLKLLAGVILNQFHVPYGEGIRLELLPWKAKVPQYPMTRPKGVGAISHSPWGPHHIT